MTDWVDSGKARIMKALGILPAVKASPDLARILAVPRRPPVRDPVREAALVDLMTRRLRRDNPKCRCAELGRPCITSLKPAQAWALYEAGIVGGILGIIGVGHGKCLNDAEFLDYATGMRRHVSDPGALEVATFDRTLRIGSARAFSSGEKPCVRVSLADGSETVASDDHPYMTARGWVPAGALRSTDFVAVATEVPEPQKPTPATDDEVALVALLLADGGCSRGMLRFTNMSPAVIAEFQRTASNVCGGWSEERSKSRARQFTVLGGDRWHNTTNPFRERWDLYGLSKNKRTHARVWGLPRHQVALFLNRFWSCDGHVSAQGVEVTLASEKLLDDIRYLLLRLGVRSRKGYTPKMLGERSFSAWRLCLYGASAMRFLDEVGDVLGKEPACQALRVSLAATRRNTNRDVVPIGRTELAEICDELGMRPWGRGRASDGRRRTAVREYFNATAGQFVSRCRFVAFCRDYAYAGKYAHLATTDVAWERVKAVDPVGTLPVWDLSVPGTHNFVANGAIVHNTGLDILAPMVVPDCKVAVILAPPGLRGQFYNDFLAWREHFRVPSLVMDDGRGCITPGAPVLHFIPFSKLSRPEATAMLDSIAPDTIIIDEAHRARHPETSTTKRIIRRFVNADKTRCLCWSGTLTASSVRDYGHLAAFAIRESSPLPLEPSVLDEWATAIDPSNDPAPAGALDALCAPGETLEQGFHRRLVETRGVISTTTGAVDAAINLYDRPVKVPKTITELLRRLRSPDVEGGWTRPDGEELVDILEVQACARQLACGFYYRWKFPHGEPEALIEDWFRKRKAYFREVRERLRRGREHMDSPRLLQNAAERHYAGYRGPLPTWDAITWPDWSDIAGRVRPEQDVVWVDDFLALDAADWLAKHKGIVWYAYDAFAERVASLSGAPKHGGGPDAGARIDAETGNRSILASLKAHGTGRDGLQLKFRNQLMANPPSSGAEWEQTLGRLHRIGQTADEVDCHVYRHTEEYRASIDSAVRKARYIEETLGTWQKLLAANCDFDVIDRSKT